LVGLGFALISQRGEPRTWGPYVWGNVLFLIGLVALHRGMERFVGTRPADREHLLTLAVGCAGFVWLGPAEDQGAMRVLLAYGSGAWVLSRALFKMLRGLRVEFGLRLTWLLATPPMVVAVLFIVRMSQQLIDLDRRFEMHFLDEGNRLLLYGYLVSAAMFNFAFIGVVPAACQRRSQSKNSRGRTTAPLLRGLRIQWFSSGNHSSRASTPRALSVL
jgi:hypothetical protein